MNFDEPLKLGQLGTVEIRSRWALAPMVTIFPEWADRPTDRHVQFYERLASSGVGLALIGATSVSRCGRGYPNQMLLDTDEKVGDFRRLAYAVLQHAPAILQLFHAGPKTSSSLSGESVVAASPLKASKSRYENARALAGREVNELTDQFLTAASRAYRAGFAGVLLHASNGYLLHTFADPTTNRRNDKWGDPDALCVDLLRSIRAVVPAGFVIGVSISPATARAVDSISDASLARVVQFARVLDRHVDLLHVYRGRNEDRAELVVSSLLREQGVASPIIEGVNVATVTDGERFLNAGASIVAGARTFLVRPEVPSSSAAISHLEAVRKLRCSGEIRRYFELEYRWWLDKLRIDSCRQPRREKSGRAVSVQDRLDADGLSLPKFSSGVVRA